MHACFMINEDQRLNIFLSSFVCRQPLLDGSKNCVTINVYTLNLYYYYNTRSINTDVVYIVCLFKPRGLATPVFVYLSQWRTAKRSRIHRTNSSCTSVTAQTVNKKYMEFAFEHAYIFYWRDSHHVTIYK